MKSKLLPKLFTSKISKKRTTPKSISMNCIGMESVKKSNANPEINSSMITKKYSLLSQSKPVNPLNPSKSKSHFKPSSNSFPSITTFNFVYKISQFLQAELFTQILSFWMEFNGDSKFIQKVMELQKANTCQSLWKWPKHKEVRKSMNTKLNWSTKILLHKTFAENTVQHLILDNAGDTINLFC